MKVFIEIYLLNEYIKIRFRHKVQIDDKPLCQISVQKKKFWSGQSGQNVFEKLSSTIIYNGNKKNQKQRNHFRTFSRLFRLLRRPHGMSRKRLCLLRRLDPRREKNSKQFYKTHPNKTKSVVSLGIETHTAHTSNNFLTRIFCFFRIYLDRSYKIY